MRRRSLWWLIAILIVVGAPVAWYVGSPLFINRTVSEAFPMSAKASIPQGMSQEQAEAEMMNATKQTVTSGESMPSGGATALTRGTFRGADDFHRGTGKATIYRVGQDRVLRFEDFQVTNGPDLFVILTKHAAPASRDDVKEGYVEIARLKGNIGSQNYTLAKDVTLEAYRSVVIYCKRFHVVFAVAALEGGR